MLSVSIVIIIIIINCTCKELCFDYRCHTDQGCIGACLIDLIFLNLMRGNDGVFGNIMPISRLENIIGKCLFIFGT